jgi:hypothetical protein
VSKHLDSLAGLLGETIDLRTPIAAETPHDRLLRAAHRALHAWGVSSVRERDRLAVVLIDPWEALDSHQDRCPECGAAGACADGYPCVPRIIGQRPVPNDRRLHELSAMIKSGRFGPGRAIPSALLAALTRGAPLPSDLREPESQIKRRRR